MKPLLGPFLGVAAIVGLTVFIVLYSKRHPKEFNRGNPFHPEGIKNPKTKAWALGIAAVIGLLQLVRLILKGP